MDINDDRRRLMFDKVKQSVGSLKGKRIGILGLTFKPNTDDLRDAPALDVARRLVEAGALVRAYDPVGMPGTARLMPDLGMAEDPYALAEGCDALVICTEWNEFKQLDLSRIRALMKTPLIVDGRNIYEPRDISALGFSYRGFGRGYGPDGTPVVE